RADAAGERERVAAARGTGKQREGTDQARDVLVRVEVAYVEDVGRSDRVAALRRRGERRRLELTAQRDRNHADLRGVHVEPRHDLTLGILRVADDRGRAGGIEARRLRDDGLADGPMTPRVVDEVQIVDRQHDRAWRADWALVVRGGGHRCGGGGQGGGRG